MGALVFAGELRLCSVGTFMLAVALEIQPARAQQNSPELIEPLVCSVATSGKIPELAGICEVTALGDGSHDVRVNLTAQTSRIKVGGYKVITENYNGHYLPPVVEAVPGDTVSARLENVLTPRQASSSHLGTHEGTNENPTNLHYFHGGIVTPNNARPPVDASQGNGDNIYVRLTNGLDGGAKPHSFRFLVPIPGEKQLDARVLEEDGFIAHPLGLNWYHSHMHGLSSEQVIGGMSGLLSVGDAKANIRALDDKDTPQLKDQTDVKYVMLRDLPLRRIGALPGDADGAEAQWAPKDQDFFESEEETCAVYKNLDSQLKDNDPKLRKGFCQRTSDSVWLFTLNGQRFPTIAVEGGRNLLLRMGNLSANVAYWLELYDERDGTVLPLTVISVDGVVPARPKLPNADKPLAAFDVADLLLMPASRAEVYVRNDRVRSHSQVYILRTKQLDVGTDRWPEIQLARIVLEPSPVTSPVAIALNAPIAHPVFAPLQIPLVEPPLPRGCVRDLKGGEHRRVTFSQEIPEGSQADWSVKTEIVHPPRPGHHDEQDFQSSDTSEEQTTIGPVPFEDYVFPDHSIDWEGERHKHVCIRLDPGGRSHKQLWVLVNNTGALHNFHIHQIKFRLATLKDLGEHRIKKPSRSHTCENVPVCLGPDYKLYDDTEASDAEPIWHDTIPMPPGERVFLIMSFDAKEQVGRFVYHCHILKHEDAGLMAPIEVWDPSATEMDR